MQKDLTARTPMSSPGCLRAPGSVLTRYPPRAEPVPVKKYIGGVGEGMGPRDVMRD